jgi:hypothetical protein
MPASDLLIGLVALSISATILNSFAPKLSDLISKFAQFGQENLKNPSNPHKLKLSPIHRASLAFRIKLEKLSLSGFQRLARFPVQIPI